MTEPSPQQPGYPTPEQQAAYAAQQQAAYAAQQQHQQQHTGVYPQQAAGPNIFDKLPMNMITALLAGGGGVAILISLLLHGAGEHLILIMRAMSPFSLAPMYAIVVLTAILVTTGPKYRAMLRTIILALALIEIGTTMSIFMFSPSDVPSDPFSGGSANIDTGAAASVIAIVLYIIAIGLFVASTFTMKEQQPVSAAGPATGMIPTAQPQQHGYVDPNQQQYPGQQQTGWQ